MTWSFNEGDIPPCHSPGVSAESPATPSGPLVETGVVPKHLRCSQQRHFDGLGKLDGTFCCAQEMLNIWSNFSHLITAYSAIRLVNTWSPVDQDPLTRLLSATDQNQPVVIYLDNSCSRPAKILWSTSWILWKGPKHVPRSVCAVFYTWLSYRRYGTSTFSWFLLDIYQTRRDHFIICDSVCKNPAKVLLCDLLFSTERRSA